MPDFSVDDVLLILRTLFWLPAPRAYKDIERSVASDYALYIDNKEVHPSKKVHELHLDERPVVTLWRVIVFCKGTIQEDKKYFIEKNQPAEGWVEVQGQPMDIPSQIAVERYEQELEKTFSGAIEQLKSVMPS